MRVASLPLALSLSLSFRATVLSDPSLVAVRCVSGYITARELKYVFVSCLGFKPSKLEIQNMLAADPATQRGSQCAFNCCLLLLCAFLDRVHDPLTPSALCCTLCLLCVLPSVLSYDQVCSLLHRKQQYQPSDSALRHLFHALDIHARGFLLLSDLLDAACSSANAPSLPLTTLLTVFAEADLDRNGKIGWSEFERIMTYSGNTAATTATTTRATMAGASAVVAPPTFGAFASASAFAPIAAPSNLEYASPSLSPRRLPLAPAPSSVSPSAASSARASSAITFTANPQLQRPQHVQGTS